MIQWSINFQVVKPVEFLPRPVRIQMETCSNASYYNSGKARRKDKHCVFVYTLQGQGRFQDRDIEYQIKPGEGFLCEVSNPQIAYFYPPQAKESWKFIWFGFTGASATIMVRELIKRYGPIFRLHKEKSIIARLMEYKKFNDTSCNLPPFKAAKLVTQVLESLETGRLAELPEDKKCTLVEQAQDIIRDNIQKRLNVTLLAQMLNISREHFSRVFKEHTGISPHKYILRQKTLLACKLLKKNQLTNKEISYYIGFDKPTNFSRSFKKLTSVTPIEFKRTNATFII